MRIHIQDDNQNWLNWGNLVQAWIDNPKARPSTVGDLKKQLSGNSISAAVEGADDRAVAIQDYPDAPTTPLVILIPTAAMRNAKIATVVPGPYNANMPLFYNIAYGGAARVNLSQQEARDFAVRRIGEYSVNECC
jgi:hypothetical protein